ncbi:unnamed protein product [Caenorhabditis auriculariae]|uniref:Uncharacterized protein n=1 Tax=Caenorhabditis auriculariae TaxID=2777116 RepID=A0A8S1HN56_9PELO|nr:unnamed protein product [Caenorhabditis auriculariae]
MISRPRTIFKAHHVAGDEGRVLADGESGDFGDELGDARFPGSEGLESRQVTTDGWQYSVSSSLKKYPVRRKLESVWTKQHATKVAIKTTEGKGLHKQMTPMTRGQQTAAYEVAVRRDRRGVARLELTLIAGAMAHQTEDVEEGTVRSREEPEGNGNGAPSNTMDNGEVITEDSDSNEVGDTDGGKKEDGEGEREEGAEPPQPSTRASFGITARKRRLGQSRSAQPPKRALQGPGGSAEKRKGEDPEGPDRKSRRPEADDAERLDEEIDEMGLAPDEEEGQQHDQRRLEEELLDLEDSPASVSLLILFHMSFTPLTGTGRQTRRTARGRRVDVLQLFLIEEEEDDDVAEAPRAEDPAELVAEEAMDEAAELLHLQDEVVPETEEKENEAKEEEKENGDEDEKNGEEVEEEANDQAGPAAQPVAAPQQAAAGAAGPGQTRQQRAGQRPRSVAQRASRRLRGLGVGQAVRRLPPALAGHSAAQLLVKIREELEAKVADGGYGDEELRRVGRLSSAMTSLQAIEKGRVVTDVQFGRILRKIEKGF